MVSKSVERVSGGDTISQVSAQSSLQRKLRLKTNKQLKIITERNGQGARPRPASSMAANTSGFASHHGSDGRQAIHSGAMNVSAISAAAKPHQGQFKIL